MRYMLNVIVLILLSCPVVEAAQVQQARQQALAACNDALQSFRGALDSSLFSDAACGLMVDGEMRLVLVPTEFWLDGSYGDSLSMSKYIKALNSTVVGGSRTRLGWTDAVSKTPLKDNVPMICVLRGESCDPY